VSFTPRAIYFRGNSFRYPFYGRLGGLQGRSGRIAEEINCLPLPEIQPILFECQTCSLVTLPIVLSFLLSCQDLKLAASVLEFLNMNDLR
jgi:hypothetical protein